MILGGSTAEKRKGGELRQVLFGNFEGKIVLYRGRRKDYKSVLEKRYIILVLNSESSFQEEVAMRKLSLASSYLPLC